MGKNGMLHNIAGALALLGCTALSSAYAADVTFERLLNPEPQNWLMNHRDFGSQRTGSSGEASR